MAIDFSRARPFLKSGNLKSLFIEELGWDHAAQSLILSVAGQEYQLNGFAKKCGVVAYSCDSVDRNSALIPDRNSRIKIHRELSKTTYEHILVFVSPDRTTQVWQWVRRVPGRPIAYREHTYHDTQPGDSLLQKLQVLAVSIEEEEQGIGLMDITVRARAAFDVDRVTRRFYDRFKREHGDFLAFVQGIEEQADREWYASVMLNRLMFIYFIQRKGFLDGDPDYLRNRLERCKRERGRDKFYSFYRFFLLRLFHEGLGSKTRTQELEDLLGKIPYLNGGLFDIHELESTERYGKTIRIPDQAFEQIFDYFDQYQWHLDERPLRADNEINPDVLGYIFEKYINQKQMGAYYTKEDITEYISKNTIIPFLFHSAREKCKVAFENPSGPTVWGLLRMNPERYIYRTVKHGVVREDGIIVPEDDLPDFVQDGIPNSAARMFNNLYNLQQAPAGDPYRLVTETWREYTYRRTRCLEIRDKLLTKEICDINEFISLNLDIRQFAQDAIETCEGPELLRAFWHAIESITILDPACGSGAFLFAALNILEPLYEACLDRMEAFLEDEASKAEKDKLKSTKNGYPLLPNGKFEDFATIMDMVADHPNERYFIFKSISLNNLFGVDIMEEAAEICKLRLFLKLVSQVEPDPSQYNFGIEPLPDIDFNIRAGNTLVGYATYDEVNRAVTSKLDFDSAMQKIAVKAADLQQASDAFRQRQTQGDGSVPMEHKRELRGRLEALQDELNQYLASEYGVKASETDIYAGWVKAHQPFQWFVEFYRIVNSGGFDVIIGNPPYVEWKNVSGYRLQNVNYTTLPCGNIYTAFCERSYRLRTQHGRFGMIVPVSCVATERMRPLRLLWAKNQRLTHASFYSGDAHPSVLFNGVKFRLAILLQEEGMAQYAEFSTPFQRWYAEGRESVFPLVNYTQSNPSLERLGLKPKLCSPVHRQILSKLCSNRASIGACVRSRSPYEVYCHRIVAHFVKAMDFVPYFCSERDGVKRSEDYKVFGAATALERDVLSAVLNSTLFYQWFVTYSDVYHCGREIILDFPVDLSALAMSHGPLLSAENDRLMKSLRHNSVRRKIPYQRTGTVEYDEFYPRLSKSVIDEIDRTLAPYYGLTEEELDFIINFDIKFRLGDDRGEHDF
jgi:hypothetical protein